MNKVEQAAKNLSSRNFLGEATKTLQIRAVGGGGGIKTHDVKKDKNVGDLTISLYNDYGPHYSVAITNSKYSPNLSVNDRKGTILMTPTAGIRKAGKMFNAIVSAAEGGEKDLTALIKAGKEAI